MLQRAIAATGICLLCVMSSPVRAYNVQDQVTKDQNIIFFWTGTDGGILNAPMKFRFTAGNSGPGTGTQFPGESGQVPFNWRQGLGGDLFKDVGASFDFPAPEGATDWHQEIIWPNGSSVVIAGNVTKNSPFRLEGLDVLPFVTHRIPDLAPLSGGDPNLAIYTAVNLGLYIDSNRFGFLDGNWSVGQTLSDLSLEIVDGQIPGLDGIYWSTTPFEFDPDPNGRGFTPQGGDANLLDSNAFVATFGTDIVILEQHIANVAEPSTLLDLVLVAFALAVVRTRQHHSNSQSRSGSVITLGLSACTDVDRIQGCLSQNGKLLNARATEE